MGQHDARALHADVGPDGAAHVSVLPWESGVEHLSTLPDADSTLPLEDWLHGRLKLAGTLTAGRLLLVPTVSGYERRIYNATKPSAAGGRNQTRAGNVRRVATQVGG